MSIIIRASIYIWMTRASTMMSMLPQFNFFFLFFPFPLCTFPHRKITPLSLPSPFSIHPSIHLDMHQPLSLSLPKPELARPYRLPALATYNSTCLPACLPTSCSPTLRTMRYDVGRQAGRQTAAAPPLDGWKHVRTSIASSGTASRLHPSIQGG